MLQLVGLDISLNVFLCFSAPKVARFIQTTHVAYLSTIIIRFVCCVLVRWRFFDSIGFKFSSMFSDILTFFFIEKVTDLHNNCE